MNTFHMAQNSRNIFEFQAGQPHELRTASRWVALYLRLVRGYELIGKSHEPRHAFLGGVRMTTYFRLRPGATNSNS